MFKKHLLRRRDWLLLDGENVDRLLHPDNWENEIRTPWIGSRARVGEPRSRRGTVNTNRHLRHFNFMPKIWERINKTKCLSYKDFSLKSLLPILLLSCSFAHSLTRSLAHSFLSKAFWSSYSRIPPQFLVVLDSRVFEGEAQLLLANVANWCRFFWLLLIPLLRFLDLCPVRVFVFVTTIPVYFFFFFFLSSFFILGLYETLSHS